MYYKRNFLVTLVSLLAILLSTSAYADTERPSAVANVTASGTSSSSITVSWSSADDNVGVDGYNLYRDGGYYATVFGTRSFTDTNVNSGRYYRYTVVAFDNARNYSIQSTSATASTSESTGDDSGVTPLASGRPDAPDALRAQVQNDSSAELSWNAPSGGAEGYNVYRDDSYFATVRGRSRYTVSSLDSDRDYSFYVVAFRNNQFSTRSTSNIVRISSASSNDTAAPSPQASSNDAAPPPPQAYIEPSNSTASIENQPAVSDTSSDLSTAVATAAQTSQAQDVLGRSRIGKSDTFANIRANGLDNACYYDAEHFVAEFLYQNPDVCFWNVDEANGTVSEVPVPEIPTDAISLPSPTGRDDTGMLEEFINSSSGKTYVGSGVYKVNNLRISTPVTLYNMPMEPYQNAYLAVSVRSADVRIFNSPIDGTASSSTNIGFDVVDGSDRFVLVNSGFSNVRGAANRNTAGVFLRGVDDFHLACNTFENIVNRSTRAGVTSRANAIWMNGGSSSSTSGGVIANNYSENLQSSGLLEDAEFFTVQGYVERGNDQPVQIFANRGVNAGKRMTKHQNSGALVYSNSYDWQDRSGELGDRRMFAMVNVQRGNDVLARNNRFMAGGNSQFDHIFHTDGKSSGVVQDNLHFDCNSIEIREKLTSQSGAAPRIINARAVPNSSSGNFEATNSSAKNNVVFGNGNVKHYYAFGAGYDRFGGRFDTRGNQFNIPYTSSQHR